MELINLSDPLIQHKDNNILLQFDLESAFTKFCNLKKVFLGIELPMLFIESKKLSIFSDPSIIINIFNLLPYVTYVFSHQGDLQFAGASTARVAFQGPVYGIIRAVSLVLLYLASSVEYDFIFILV